MTYVHGQDLSDCGKTGGDTQESILSQEERLHQPPHTQPCPGSGERQAWRGGKGHDVHMGMTYNIVAKQECGISVSHLYK